MDMEQYAEGESISVDFIERSVTKIGVIISSGELVAFGGKDKPRFKIEIAGTGKQKYYSPNMYSVRNLVEAWGTNSEGWVGKAVHFEVIEKNGRQMIIASPSKAVTGTTHHGIPIMGGK